MGRLNVTVDSVTRVQQEIYDLQEEWNRWAEANNRHEQNSPDSFEVLKPVAPFHRRELQNGVSQLQRPEDVVPQNGVSQLWARQEEEPQNGVSQL